MPTPGRPRDTRIDDAVLQATRELVGEVGYSDLTFKAIAARAGTSVPALRRRWPTKAHVVHQAVFPDSVAPSGPPAEHLADEVRLVVRRCAELMCSDAGRRATPGLISDLVVDIDLQRQLTDRLRRGVWEGLGARLHEAAVRGEARADVDISLFIEMVFGAALMAVVMRGPDALGDDWQEELTRSLMSGLTG